MNNTTSSIITIGREYGSAGRQIGQEVARYFGIKCYDKELLEHAANDSGICKELFENHDERPTNSFLYSLVMDTCLLYTSTRLPQVLYHETRPTLVFLFGKRVFLRQNPPVM